MRADQLERIASLQTAAPILLTGPFSIKRLRMFSWPGIAAMLPSAYAELTSRSTRTGHHEPGSGDGKGTGAIEFQLKAGEVTLCRWWKRCAFKMLITTVKSSIPMTALRDRGAG